MGMIKNQEEFLYSDSLSFYKLRRDKHLYKSVPNLQFTLYAVTHFVQFLKNLFNLYTCSSASNMNNLF